MTEQWPRADIDDIARLRALAAGIRGARVGERLVDAPFDAVWGLLSDLEGSFGDIEPDMRRLTVVRRDGDRLEALARSRFGMRARLRGIVRPGWGWLQSRFLLIGFAAVAETAGTTRVAMTGGLRVPGRAALVPIRVAAAARGSLERLAREAERP